MRILILGASGTVGQAVYRALEGKHAVFGTCCRHPDKDGRLLPYDHRKDDLSPLLDRLQPDVLLSSLSGPAEGQLHAHAQMAGWCAKNGARLLFISTANVFDAMPKRPFSETDPTGAASLYGRFKLQVEEQLSRTLGQQLLIVRLPLVLTPARVRSLLTSEPVAYTNWSLGMTTARTVGQGIAWLAAQSSHFGIVHLGSRDCMLHSEFVRRAAPALDMQAEAFRNESMTWKHFNEKLSATFTPAHAALQTFCQSLTSVRADVPPSFHPSCTQALSDTLAIIGSSRGTGYNHREYNENK